VILFFQLKDYITMPKKSFQASFDMQNVILKHYL